MNLKTVKCRKQHECDYCGGTILVGETASYYEVKIAKLNNEETKQIGIHYFKWWEHIDREQCEN